ncbi:glycosyl hydrolase family 31, partial [bacterium]|nr:glycosyl hydrolase family 31 [bacterium]
MKQSFLFLSICLIMMGSLMGGDYNPVADPDAILTSGNARFTLLTPGVVRMEWAEDGVFEDHASLAFVNRHLPVPKFKTKTRDEWLQITTTEFTLKYKVNSGKFDADNLRINFKLEKEKQEWKPGQENKGNLLGTRRTLDGFDGDIMQW